jgi:hypothetical protein
MLLARQHGGPQGIERGLNQNRKTNPEQTLSVPVVFRNRLKFSEFVKTAEIIWRSAAGRDRRAPAAAVHLHALKLFWLTACGPACAEAWHQSPTDIGKGLFHLHQSFTRRERNEAKTPTFARETPMLA